MQLLFFGRFSDIATSGPVDLPDRVIDIQTLTAWLSEKYEGFEDLVNRAGSRIALNKEIIHSNALVTNSDEIAFMSALSGG